MGAVRRSRGRLPRRVYWVRRSVLLLAVVGLVLGVVVAVARLTVDTATDAADQATTASGEPATTVQAPAPTLGPGGPAVVQQPENTAPAAPSGPCEPRDVRAVPVLDAPEAGGRVTIGIDLTGTQAACTFEVSPKSLVVKIVDEEGRDFWRSQECQDVVPKQEVVVRSAEATRVEVRWSSRASARGCGDYDRWALPGFYDALASVQGSSPEQVRFELLAPSVRYVTETPSPTPQPTPAPAAPATPAPADPSAPAAPPAG